MENLTLGTDDPDDFFVARTDHGFVTPRWMHFFLQDCTAHHLVLVGDKSMLLLMQEHLVTNAKSLTVVLHKVFGIFSGDILVDAIRADAGSPLSKIALPEFGCPADYWPDADLDNLEELCEERGI